MNSRTLTAGWLVSAAVLSSWAVSSASDQPRPAPSLAPQRAAPALPELSVEVDAEITRLSARTALAAAPPAPGRDPFRFSAGKRRSAGRATAVSEFPSVSVSSEREESSREAVAFPDAAKQPTLSGIAEISAGTMTAIVSFAGELHYARVGDVIAGRYRIVAIALGGVDIFDLVVGTISTLKLQA